MLKKNKTERMIWLDIMITLLALTLMSYFYYGVRALVLGGVCIAASLAAELVSLRLMHRKFTADDLSCTSDGLIIALMMPAAIKYEIPAIACIFAVTAAKNIFGGRKNMIFSPAAAAYLFILTSWSSELLSYPQVYDKVDVTGTASDLVSSASHILNTAGTMSASDFEILLGSFAGPMGTASILLLMVSAVILIFRRDISAGAFTGTILGTVFMAYFCPVAASGADSVKYVLATNMILFAAVYIISDLRIAPRRNYYAFFYGFFIAITSYVVMLTTGKENVIVIMSVLFTPVSLGFKNLQKKIDTMSALEREAAAAEKAPEITAMIPEDAAQAAAEESGEADETEAPEAPGAEAADESAQSQNASEDVSAEGDESGE